MSNKKEKTVKSTKPKKRVILRDNINGITQPALKRILRRAGVKRINSMVYEELRGILKVYVENIMRRCVTFMEHERRHTVRAKDLENALDVMGIYLAAGVNPNATKTVTLQSCNSLGRTEVESKSTKRHKPGEMAKRNIKFQQQNSDCLAIPKIPFHRLVMEVGQDYSDHIRYSGAFNDLMQLVCETILVKICEAAYEVTKVSERETLMTKDIHIARRIATIVIGG